jgi:hypothetical protein
VALGTDAGGKGLAHDGFIIDYQNFCHDVPSLDELPHVLMESLPKKTMGRLLE